MHFISTAYFVITENKAAFWSYQSTHLLGRHGALRERDSKQA
jgi:hypothetical protein